MDQVQLNDTNNTTTTTMTTTTQPVTRKGKRWTPEEDLSLLTQLNNNTSFDDIATNQQRTVGGITMRVLMHAVAAVKNGVSLEDAAQQFRLSVEQITQGINKQVKLPKPTTQTTGEAIVPKRAKGKKWTDDEDNHLRMHLANGVALDVIAATHQRIVPAIKARSLKLAVSACTIGMSHEEASALYRIPIDKLTKRVPIVTNIPANPQVDVLIEIRDLLRVLVAHLTKEQTTLI